MKYILFLSLLALAACGPRMTPQQTALLKLMADRPITCAEGEDCAAKWSRAVQWVVAHAQEGMKTVTDDLIVTRDFSGGGRNALRYPEFTVVRYAAGPHSFAMEFTSYCEHGFVCGDNALKLRAWFTNAVMGLPPGVRETGPGAYRVKERRLDGAARQ